MSLRKSVLDAHDEKRDEEADVQVFVTLMHLKCIPELCTIIVIFHSYLHHIRGILLLFNDFW